MPSAPDPAAVLVVSARAGCGHALAALLVAAGHGPVSRAASNDGALRQVRRRRPDVVVVDHTSTAGDNPLAMITLLSAGHGLPVVVVGMNAALGSSVRRAGARHYLDIATAADTILDAVAESVSSVNAR